MGEKENGTLNTAIKTGFTEEVTFEKEANCVAVWGKACPRQGEQPGQRPEAYLTGSRSSKGGM